jgi:hypothetical protein
MTSTTLTPNTRVVHRTHPEYGFGLVRCVEEDAFGEVRLQVAFGHLDGVGEPCLPGLALFGAGASVPPVGPVGIA